jgi:microcin C transport system substrate-binding protein
MYPIRRAFALAFVLTGTLGLAWPAMAQTATTGAEATAQGVGQGVAQGTAAAPETQAPAAVGGPQATAPGAEAGPDAGAQAGPEAGPEAGPQADAAETTVSHGISAFGDLKYGPDFQHFDFVNPDAPTGGVWSTGYGNVTFDSFNPFILKGNPAIGVAAFLYDSLMVGAADEPDAMYGLVAQSAEMPEDRSWVAFDIRPEARFQDGTPITAEDVVFSFETLRDKGHPSYRVLLEPVASATAEGERRVRFDFVEAAPKRDLPMLVAGLPILSKAFYTENDFTRSTLKEPVGSGAYRIGGFRPNQSVTFERVEDYWAKDLPVNIGRNNFDQVRIEYFRDRSAAFEAFKAGAFLFNEEFTSQTWATSYTPQAFPAVAAGDVVLDTLPDNRPAGTQGFWFNLRRAKFEDPRVREAIALAFDFEWSNERLFYDLYTRTDSFFEGGPMQAEGPPTPGEMAILERFADKLPPEVLSEAAYVPPTTDATGRNRQNLRRAAELLEEAGWTVEGGVRRKDGRPLEIEFLLASQGFERIVAPLVQNLEKIGVRATIREVDAAQEREREQKFDYDIIVDRNAMSLTPGVELRDYFGSASANSQGSANTAGVSDPVVDGLIDIIERADSRDTLTDAVKALDRVLRAKHIWIPNWNKASHTIAYWDVFEQPEIKPEFAPGYPDTWWMDVEAYAAMQAAGKI